MSVLGADQIDDFQRDGVLLLSGVFADWIETLRRGVDTNMANPGPTGREGKTLNYTAAVQCDAKPMRIFTPARRRWMFQHRGIDKLRRSDGIATPLDHAITNERPQNTPIKKWKITNW